MLDVRFALRGLRRTPTFFLVAVLTIASGIASTTALAAVGNGVLLRLPFADAGRLIRFSTADAATQIAGEVSYAQVEDWRRMSRTLDGLAGIGSTNWSFAMGGDDPVNIPYAAVSASFFDVLGSAPLLGRAFGADDEPAGAPGVVVLSYALWRSRFGSDPSILGRTVILSGSSFSVIGVMPPDFRYPLGAQLWTPVAPRLAEAGRPRSPSCSASGWSPATCRRDGRRAWIRPLLCALNRTLKRV